MSASNWDVCPKCVKAKEAADQKAKADVDAAYGKMKAADYLDLLKKTEAKCEEAVPQTLREDWELGISSECKFYVIYKAECRECGFSHSYRHEQAIDLNQPPKRR